MDSLEVPEHACYHCLLDIPKHSNFSVLIDGSSRAMCCPGCSAVAQTIIDSGLHDYYRHRTDNPSGQSLDPQSLVPEELTLYNSDKVQGSFVNDSVDGFREATLVIEGITCAACIWLLEHHLQTQPGVQSFSVNMSNHRAQISWDREQIQLSEILSKIYQIGYRGHPYRPDIEEQLLAREQKRAMLRLGVAGVGMMQVLALAIALYAGGFQGIESSTEQWLRWSSFVICTPIIFYAALPFFSAAYRDLKTYHLSMDVPVSIAIGGAFIASAWATISHSGEIYFDSVSMFTFFLLFGRYLEMQARHRTGRAGNALQNLFPQAAIQLIVDDRGNTKEQLISAAELEVGNRILVKPGQLIPADATISSGFSSIDESALTGEYMPQRRCIGEAVIGGTLNVENPIQLTVTHVGSQTQLSAIVRLLERAASEKPKVAKLADKVANYFVACVLLAAIVVSISWYFIDPEKAFWITLSVLVVTCPCALSLATPTALTTATGNLRQRGLLITRGHVLESLALCTDIVFDKTGTLTQGNLCIEKTIAEDPESALRIAAALEANSEHPIAQAFRFYLQHSADNIAVTLGQGIEGIVGGDLYRIGKPQFAAKLLGPGFDCPSPDSDGHWLLLCNEKRIIGWFLIADSLRVDSKDCVKTLQRLGINVHMLTGDSSSSGPKTAAELGIQQLCAGASPEQKNQYIQTLQQSGAKVLMVGDGINDLPVLAGTQTSIAMGSASDLAKTHADAVLTNGELTLIGEAVLLAKKTNKIIKQNIAWAFSYNMTALPLAALGLIPPYAAAIGMSLSSLLVVFNALRLGKK
ncbi:MAG: putative cation-transporting P-type ATPase [Osedax symbiont Rs2]|nr:MAG: putative cation-transporting P-type ATPase [Osedax symbiont Rs2]